MTLPAPLQAEIDLCEQYIGSVSVKSQDGTIVVADPHNVIRQLRERYTALRQAGDALRDAAYNEINVNEAIANYDNLTK